MAYFEINNYYKNFGNTEVLKGISFSIEKGQVISIIGSSGSGKTTLLRCINFLEIADKGEMILDGESLFYADSDKKFNESDDILRQKRLNFGLVFQSFNLFPQYNVLDNLTLAPNLLLKDEVQEYKKTLTNSTVLEKRNLVKEYIKKRKEEIEKDGLDLLEKVGLIDKVKSYPCELSGGQCQRVAIARALALKPKILCFDEPTSALDPELTGEVLKVIKELQQNLKITMIIVTHEMEFAKNISDKVMFMANGVVEEFGTPDEVFNNPKGEAIKQFLQAYNENKA